MRRSSQPRQSKFRARMNTKKKILRHSAVLILYYR